MRATLCSLALLFLASCGDAVPSTRASEGEQNVTADGAALRESCATLLSDLELSYDFGTVQNSDVTIDSHASGLPDCADFAWARGALQGSARVSPAWAGPALTTSAWDCNHSSLEYAVYRLSSAGWQYVDGALAYGALSAQGVCGYSVNNAPRQDGHDETIVLAEPDATTEVRVGLRAWSHNDPALGHSGSDCETLSCYWPVRLSLTAY
jgi:hypothetical protein